MPAGTITLTNNSTAVTGSGTAFATELKANDFLVAIVGGTTYTLGVKSVESATALTLTTAYGGPTAGGLAWTPIPNGTLVGITAQIAADTARAIRGLNYDKQNWQQVYSASGNITVTLPDGSTWTGPSWKYLTDNMATKVGGAVPLIQGGTGSKEPFGKDTGTFCQGNDARLNSVDDKTGGTIRGGTSVIGNFSATGNITCPKGAGFSVTSPSTNFRTEINAANTEPTLAGGLLAWYRVWWYSDWAMLGVRRSGSSNVQDMQITFQSTASTFTFSTNGTATATGAWSPNSDSRIKDKIAPVEDPLDKMRAIRGCTWTRLDSGAWGIGFIAQEVQTIFPEAVSEGDDRELPDGTLVEKVLSPDTYGVAAALHHEALLVLMDKVERLESELAILKGRD
jgi:hypothetical protein